MSWNNIIPWKMIECQRTCKEHDPETGYVIHVPECELGKEVEERIRREKQEHERTQDRQCYPKGP